MLRCIIVSPTAALASSVDGALKATGLITVVKIVNHYPAAAESKRLVQSSDPHVVFVSLERPSETVRVAQEIERFTTQVQTVAVGNSMDPQALMTVMSAGIEEFLAAPINASCLVKCLERLTDKILTRV